MVTDEMHRSIGRVVVNFNALEYWVGTWAGQLITWDPMVGQIITSEMSFRNKRALFSSLCRHVIKDEDLLQKVDDMLQEMARIEQDRNTLIHSCWLEHKSGPHLRQKITSKEGKGLKQGISNVGISEVSILADRIRDIDMVLTVLSGRLLEWSSRGKTDRLEDPPGTEKM